MKIVEFFLILQGNLSELEPEPEFSTSWSRKKMDRLRNTAAGTKHQVELRVLHLPQVSSKWNHFTLIFTFLAQSETYCTVKCRDQACYVHFFSTRSAFFWGG
jgi:hypothetical protein